MTSTLGSRSAGGPSPGSTPACGPSASVREGAGSGGVSLCMYAANVRI